MGKSIEKLNELKDSNVSKLGLVRVRELLKRLKNPQNELKCVHVAGTNGKGSVCSYIEAVLRRAGYKTALFTSPHIHTINEYIKIDGESITDDELEKLAEHALEICEKMVSDGFEHPTFFEVMTAIAFERFSESDTDISVIEVGMGGKGDATNLIEPLVSVITNISLDHTQALGDSIKEIAGEKAGIIKPSVPVVIAPHQPRAAYKVIKRQCKRLGSDLLDAGHYAVDIYKTSLKHISFTAKNEHEKYRFKIHSAGRHQAQNVLTALCAVKLLGEKGFDISYSNIKNGMSSASAEARMQVYPDKKVIIDVSHNAQSVSKLCEFVKEQLPDEKTVLLCSLLATKDADAIAYEYAKFIDYAILTESENSLSLSAEKLETAFLKQGIECVSEKDLSQACKEAVKKCGDDDAYLIVSGSFYIVSQVKKDLDLADIN